MQLFWNALKDQLKSGEDFQEPVVRKRLVKWFVGEMKVSTRSIGPRTGEYIIDLWTKLEYEKEAGGTGKKRSRDESDSD